MRRFLVVGCGGSGGATLAYLMDQLASDLAAIDRRLTLPAGWQFVHLDVPSGPEPGPDGLGNVPQQGGRYLGLGPKGGSYSDLDYAVSQKLLGARALDELAGWAPRQPQSVATPIDVGAGQYRSIGRMITLARAGEVHQGLQSAWEQLARVETLTEMGQLADAVGSTFNANETPIVLVVTSMAGGSGASMALDVCRLLTLVPGVNPKLTAVFMVAPDIFDSLPPSARSGVRANALAMLGEIVAGQTGAARRHDVEILSGLGYGDGQGTEIPFARVFPIGRFIGAQRTMFGDGSPKAVYRGLARGLGGMMISEVASTQFVSFDLGNTGSIPPDSDYLAWGAQLDPIPWGSYGFASLSMGRERYAEYAAQRIARGAVDRLLDGHLQPGNSASGTEQVKALVDSQWARLCERLQLPVGLGSGQQAGAELGSWMTTVALPRADADAAARRVVDAEYVPHLPSPGGQQARQWLEAVQQRSRSRGHVLAEAAGKAAYDWAFAWQQGLLDRLVAVLTEGISRLGLPYAAAVLERLDAHLRGVVIPGTEALGRTDPGSLAELPSELRQAVAAIKGAITGGDTLVERLVDGVRIKVRTQLYTRASALTADALATFIPDVLTPLTEAIREAQRVLEQARGSQVKHDGLARLATDQYAAWPSDADVKVPSRFDEAGNEVLLTPARDFAAQYAADLARAVPTDDAGNSPAQLVPSQVIEGVWETTGGERPPALDPHQPNLIVQTAPWRSRVFPTNPATGDALIPSRARFGVHVKPGEVLERARAFVARSEQSFQRFCAVSLRDFINGPEVAESERHARIRDVTTKFTEALALAMPLIGVDEQVVRLLHGGQPVEYRYKFSDVPFAELPIADDLERILVDNPSIDASSRDNLGSALTDQGNPRRIDIFGSYPLYSPLAFSSVLRPIAEQWGATTAQGREAFWAHRRSRPLDAALPMANVERRTLVAGWYLGQIVGELVIPPSPYDSGVRILDRAAGEWVEFPYPMLTPPQQFVAPYDWLPAVLESQLLAIARVHESPVLSSLRPYRLLRALYDSNPLRPAGGIVPLSGRERLAAWIRGGGAETGVASRVPALAEAATPEQRRDAAKEWLNGAKGPGTLASVHFMPAGVDGAPGGGAFATITSRDQASQTPTFRDLAPDIHWAARQLTRLLDDAYQLALADPNAARGSADGRPGPAPRTTIELPEGGVY
ncbi:tubulin-like doman-containing protein [Microlunatus parietis]|uniref:Tubulin like n=1 Tax=Microlunatus parietis TaxID=682979 RepID=A0A7Y9I827_9ACTN|nr:tubulin-like doman-containing protein [Microlunatus parietis]NYE72056.1 hypothetical protein [Microlunatus parietis]